MKRETRVSIEATVLFIVTTIALLLAFNVSGCSVEGVPLLPDGGVDTAPIVKRGEEAAELMSTSDASVDSGQIERAVAVEAGPSRVPAQICGWANGPTGYVPCCPPGDDCKITINPDFDYCDCAASPPSFGWTECHVSATHYPMPETMKQAYPSVCVQR